MARFKGTIALDIDGTITVAKHSLNPRVKKALESWIDKGWEVVFITGRTFSFARPIVSSIDRPFGLAVQNGAALYEMPGEKLQGRYFLPSHYIERLNAVLKGQEGGLLVESGKERGDVCYFVPKDFSDEEGKYLHFRMEIAPESWHPIDSFADFPYPEFSVAKYFARQEKAQEIGKKMAAIPGVEINVIVIRDPFRPGYHLAHVNAAGASKGNALTAWLEIKKRKGPVIVAGDDYNDVEMLERADVKIVMENAPEELHMLADILAPPADEDGIIPALEEAIQAWVSRQTL